MYSLFEIRKVLSVSKPGGCNGAKILLAAYTENKAYNILALVCSNGYLLFRHVSSKLNAPVIRQLCWFNNPEKQIKALSFDSSGMWLLTVTQDATLFILPVFPLLESVAKIPASWKTDNLTEIKLTGQRALTTSVQWWLTHEDEHIAIIGSELGEISFINLVNKKEVGGTYITSGISALDILYDENHDTTYLLITGSNQQQWRLLLEEKKSNFYWPFNTDTEITTYNSGKSLPVTEKMPLADDKNGDQRPHRLSKFESGTFLTPQCGGGRNLVSAYNSLSCLLQVLEGDLDRMHLFSYKVPPDCENIILSDKLIFATSKNQPSNQHVLKIISRKFAEISSENSKKRETQNTEIQKFVFNDEILAIYKAAIRCPNKMSVTKNSQSASVSNSEKSSNNILSSADICFVQSKSSFESENVQQKLNALINEQQNLEGCILVQNDCVWECRLRISAEALFLSLTATPSDLPLAEKLGVMLGLDLHKLYDIAADIQLSSGQFAQAVHLYQLSKCPQLKRVAHFMGYGFLSELIAYTQVLFSTKSVEIVSADKCHFANIALHCFAHQVKNKFQDRRVINLAFKKFLKENSYYDEEVAAKLFSEQGLNELLYYFAKVRGQQGLIVETLLSTDGIKATIETDVYNALSLSGYEVILHHTNDEYYMKCMTSYNLLQFLAAKPSLLNLHLQHLITLLPKMSVPMLRRVASLYDPSRHVAKLFFRNLAVSKLNKRYWSLSSLTTITNEMHEINPMAEEISTVEDVIKFFIFVLLMLFHKIGCPKFSHELIEASKNKEVPKRISSRSHSIVSDSAIDSSSISCGQAHVAYLNDGVLYSWGKSSNGRLGTEDINTEYQPPQPVLTFLRLQVNVLAVSCGALHTLAITDFGLFGWGSSRFGQLGMGELQQTVQPRVIESLLSETIVKVECGQYHSAALNVDGRVFTWGWGVHGQLGHGNAEDIFSPKMIESLKKKKIVSIAAGQGHTVLLNKNGNVYTFGCGMFGQLGTGSVLKQSNPQLVNIPERIKLIATGHFHVLAVSRINKVYSWGCNPQALRLQAQNSRRARHHLSNDSSSSSNHSSSPVLTNNSLHRGTYVNGTIQQSHLLPNLVNVSSIDDTITQLSCGSHHSVLITASGKIFSWGRNSEGQIGNGTRKEQKIPSLIISFKEKKMVHAACGADFTVAMDSYGKIYAWGQNDGGQVGQKPSSEPTMKCSSGSTSGRVITIRTNRRMITITQPCRRSILRPVEIVIPHYDVKNPGFLDSGSFENEFPIMKMRHHSFITCDDEPYRFDLSNLDDPSKGPFLLHSALEIFHAYCDSSALLNHCLNFGNFQAAAKLCALEKMFDQAVKYELEALESVSKSSPMDSQVALNVISFYTNLLDHENIDLNKKFLTHIIKFWIKNNLPVHPLESFFQYYQHIFAFPLSLLILSENIPELDLECHSKFLMSLSTRFCLTIIHGVLQNVEQGCHLINLLEEMDILSDTANVLNPIQASDALTWDDSIPQDRLWLDVMHNLQTGVLSHSGILLTSSDVDLLAKSLLSEKLYVQSFNNTLSSMNKLNSNGCDAVIFSCGHHYTFPAFQANILPLFKESLHSQFYSIPLTMKFLLSEYQEDLVTAACPKCVGAEINNDL